MNDLNKKFEAVEHLVDELRQHHSTDPKEVEQVLTSMLELVRNVDADQYHRTGPR